jgi:hypothetical protein
MFTFIPLFSFFMVSDDSDVSLYKLLEFIIQLVKNISHMLLITWPLLLPVLVFALFVLVNEGIVLGKRDKVFSFLIPFD